MTNELFPVPGGNCSGDFKLSITRALADQLADALDRLVPAPLTVYQIANLDKRPGVYELFVSNHRVYVGKTAKDLQGRLEKHQRKLSGRSNIVLDHVTFQCLYVDEDLDAASPEKLLIKKYRNYGGAPWNTNGFGNNDPGRNRDNSLVKANHFDAHYPINLDLEIDSFGPHIESIKHLTIKKYLTAVKSHLPFNFRFENSSIDYRTPMIEIPRERPTARELVRLALEALPEGWQATALPGYVILYNEDKTYDSARVLWSKQRGVVIETEGAKLLDTPGDIETAESDDD